jgi:cytochrome c556
MHRLFALLLALAASGFVIVAAEKPPADYQAAMKELGTFAAGIDAAVKTEDYDAIVASATKARDAFAVTENYWKGKDAEAVGLARRGWNASSDLIVMSGIKNQEGVAFAATEARSTCMECHATHRERLADGTFEIK